MKKQFGLNGILAVMVTSSFAINHVCQQWKLGQKDREIQILKQRLDLEVETERAKAQAAEQRMYAVCAEAELVRRVYYHEKHKLEQQQWAGIINNLVGRSATARR